MNTVEIPLTRVALVICLMGCSVFSTAQTSSDLRELREWMTGYFSSEQQSLQDTNFFDIRLSVYPIWGHRTDGYWLYVEQASATALDKPYRQRIYQLTLTSRGIESIIYTFSNPLDYAGRPEEIENLKRENLTTREGCEVVLTRKDKDTFTGSTIGKNCPSELRGASYATSEAMIRKDEMVTLDMGFNTSDIQVWGSTHGGYHFRKLKK